MTQQRDIDRLLDHWFSDGPTVVADRVIDAVADRIEHQSQRPAWRLRLEDTHPGRDLRLAATAAAIAIAVTGVILFGRMTGSSVGGPGATPTPTSTPTAAPTIAPRTFIDNNNKFGLSFQNPGAWSTSIDGVDWVLLSPFGQGSFDGVAVFRKPSISVQDATCTNKPLSGVGHGVDDFIAYLTRHKGLVSSTPVAVTIGTLTGRSIDVHVGPSWAQTCPGTAGPTVMYLTEDLPEPDYGWGTDSTEYQRMAFLDGGPAGVIVVGINVPNGAGLFEQRIRDTEPILDSLTFPGVRIPGSRSPGATP